MKRRLSPVSSLFFTLFHLLLPPSPTRVSPLLFLACLYLPRLPSILSSFLAIMVASMKLLLVLGLASVADLTSALPVAAPDAPVPANPAAILSRFLGSGGAARLRVRAPCVDDACHHGDAGHIAVTTTTSVWTPPPTPVHTPATEVNVANTCYPNFEGNPVRVKASDGDATWCIPAIPGSLPAHDAKLEALNGSTTSFRVEYTGFDDNTYLIK